MPCREGNFLGKSAHRTFFTKMVKPEKKSKKKTEQHRSKGRGEDTK
jgi:hypothetical protein